MGGSPLLGALGLLSAVWPFHGERQTEARHYLIPAWHVDTVRDKFTGELRCRVYQGSRKRPDVSYAQGAIVFRFAKKLDTAKASFRLDNGPVQAWNSIYPQLIGAGVRVRGKSLDNPTDGEVMLPEKLLAETFVVTIRPTPDRKPRQFSIAGYADAITSGEAQGCNSRTGFVA